MDLTAAGSQPGAIGFFCCQYVSIHSPNLRRDPERKRSKPPSGSGVCVCVCVCVSHPLCRLQHTPLHWSPAALRSVRWRVNAHTSSAPRPTHTRRDPVTHYTAFMKSDRHHQPLVPAEGSVLNASLQCKPEEDAAAGQTGSVEEERAVLLPLSAVTERQIEPASLLQTARRPDPAIHHLKQQHTVLNAFKFSLLIKFKS